MATFGSVFSDLEALVWCFPLIIRSANLVLTFGSFLSGAIRCSLPHHKQRHQSLAG